MNEGWPGGRSGQVPQSRGGDYLPCMPVIKAEPTASLFNGEGWVTGICSPFLIYTLALA